MEDYENIFADVFNTKEPEVNDRINDQIDQWLEDKTVPADPLDFFEHLEPETLPPPTLEMIRPENTKIENKNIENVLVLLTHTLRQVNHQYGILASEVHELRRSNQELKRQIDELSAGQEILVDAKRRKLELGKGYREKKRRAASISPMIDDFVKQKTTNRAK